MNRISWESRVDIVALLFLFLYSASQVPGAALISGATPTGGDTGSHYALAQWTAEHLLPDGRLIRWHPGNFGGHTHFLFYFPLTFFGMAVANKFLPFFSLPFWFNLFSLGGTFLLPFFFYLAMRLIRLNGPGPVLAAVGAFVFSYVGSNSMFGGNWQSTLAGEFSYSWSFGLVPVFLALCYRAFSRAGGVLSPALCLTAIALTHGFTVILSMLTCVAFLLVRDPRTWATRFVSLTAIWSVGLGLAGFWLFQLWANLPFTTPFHLKWSFTSFREVVPVELWPFLPFYLAGWGMWIKAPQFREQMAGKLVLFSGWIVGMSLLCFLSAESLGLPDIRFVPFCQISVAVVGACVLAHFMTETTSRFPAGVWAVVLLGILWVSSQNPVARGWMTYNFSGLEKGERWPYLQQITKVLQGRLEDPRVAVEHSSRNQSFGTVRVFETLPELSSRSTLEGLYMQASLLSPAIFFLQSLISEEQSCPFPEYVCGSMDYKRALPLLDWLGADDLLISSKTAKDQVRSLASESGTFSMRAGGKDSEYEIWSRKRPEPFRWTFVPHSDWDSIRPTEFRFYSYRWWARNPSVEPIPYTLPQARRWLYPTLDSPFPARFSDRRNYSDTCVEREQLSVEQEAFSFQTQCLGQPHLIRFAYHPAWTTQGADGPYWAGPGLLMVVPTQKEVSLRFDVQRPRWMGFLISAFALLLVSGLIWRGLPAPPAWLGKGRSMGNVLIALGVSLLILGAFRPSYLSKVVELRSLSSDGERWDHYVREVNKTLDQWPAYPRNAEILRSLGDRALARRECSTAKDAYERILRSEVWSHSGLDTAFRHVVEGCETSR